MRCLCPIAAHAALFRVVKNEIDTWRCLGDDEDLIAARAGVLGVVGDDKNEDVGAWNATPE
jgi:hypothetical protein